jgi:hypothetical protein
MTGSLFDVIVVLVLLTAVFVVFIGEWLPPIWWRCPRPQSCC